MNAVLQGMGYNGWILPVLLALPLLGAVTMAVQGIGARGQDTLVQMQQARRTALLFFVAEAVLSEEELRSRYSGWSITVVPEPGASSTFMAKKLVA